MAPWATMRFVQARLGVTPGWGGGTRLRRLVRSRADAIRLLCGSEPAGAQLALSLGLADMVTAAPGLEFLQEEPWRHIQQQPYPHAVRAARAVIAAAEELGPEDARARETEVFSTRWGGADNRRAISQSQHGPGKRSPKA
jgi:ethylmalonyl-CoA/methylmalonyl-CoA decarboxylase